MSFELYRKLESTDPCCLKGAVNYLTARSVPVEFFTSLPYVQLPGKKVVRMYVFPNSRKRILESKKDSPVKSGTAEQLVYNYNPFAEATSKSIDIKFDQIDNPWRSFLSFRGAVFWGGSSLDWVQTWGPQANQSPKYLTDLPNRKK